MSAPTVRRRRLGKLLRGLREAAGMTLEDVERTAGFTTAKLSRIETARVATKTADVEKLLHCYAVEDDVMVQALTALAREGKKRGWWEPYRDVLSAVYADLISLEADASEWRAYYPLLVPGLLQTSAYARAMIGAINMTSPPATVNRLVEVRMGRQSVLTRDSPLEVWAVLPEAALRMHLPEPIMRDQCQRLLDLSDLPNVNVQLMPLDAAPHPGVSGGFAMLTFPEQQDMDIVLVENLTTSLYIEDDVDPYRGAFSRLQAAALPFEESLQRIAKLKEGYK
ncbi:helix-turn-helix domain-containing protein [Embleya sp. NPDC050493]|uniref:helix-turn-helix domain-containing protein n=1 Tax=Embleya sp. NPDC050493 TaxID=3363989 RepID=UPI0037A25259